MKYVNMFYFSSISVGEAINGNFSSPSVICDATGFQPSFNYSTNGEDPNVSIDMIMGGSSSNDPNCVAQLNTTTGNLTILMGDFSINYTQSIPYATNGNATCGGTLQHWIDMDNGNKEMIRFEVRLHNLDGFVFVLTIAAQGRNISLSFSSWFLLLSYYCSS